MSPDQVQNVIGLLRFPRVSGDEPSLALSASRVIAFSPRERG